MAAMEDKGEGWAVYSLDDVDRERRRRERQYLEFHRVPDLSTGLYVLAAGAEDPQSPHTEDEIYHVLAGRAMIRMGEEDRPVSAGSVVYVKAGVPHKFHTIEEDLRVLVVFAPAYGSHQPDGQ